MIQRLLSPLLKKATKSVLLLGPRQSGKSTLIDSLHHDLKINLARESEYLRHSTDPDLLESLIEQQKPKTVFIDEIQRIPSLLNTIQAIIDESKSKKDTIRFFLSGSSARKLKRGQANLLPGRIISYSLSGFCAKELNYKLSIPKALKHGCLPEPYLESSDPIAAKVLETYSAVYLKEEIQAEALTKNIQGFARFLNTIADYSGLIFDATKVAQKGKVSRSSTLRFVEILEDTLIAHRVPVFLEGHTADVIRHPKLYIFDVGVLNGLLNNFAISQDRIGNLFEHLVYSQLRNSAIAADIPIEISFFRTRSGVEVDFIVKLRKKVWAIEVKAGDVISSDLNNLKKFKDYYPQVHKCVVVSMKEKARLHRGILICSVVDLLKEMDI